ncbi:MAG: preprotein translocase subunit SecE [Brevundimonas sp.]
MTVDTPAAKKRVSPGQFLSQVRAEGRKITWPSRKETWITSVMVLILVLIAALFFWVVDFGLGWAFQQIISFGR